MRGELTFESRTPDAAAVAYAKSLGDVLREARPRELNVRGTQVFVRGGIFRFVSSWNLLVGVTSATVEAIPGQNQVTVRYDIKVTELLVFCAFATFFVLVVATSTDGSWFAAIAAPIVVWGWLFGMNYLVTRSRMTSAFRRVAKQVSEAEPRTTGKGAG